MADMTWPPEGLVRWLVLGNLVPSERDARSVIDGIACALPHDGPGRSPREAFVDMMRCLDAERERAASILATVQRDRDLRETELAKARKALEALHMPRAQIASLETQEAHARSLATHARAEAANLRDLLAKSRQRCAILGALLTAERDTARLRRELDALGADAGPEPYEDEEGDE